jgi:hypothetical protein
MANSRQWYHRANIPFPDVSTAAKQSRCIPWLIKASLMDQVTTGTLGPEGAPPGGAAWGCVGSSDGVTANMIGTDLWGSVYNDAKIVRASAGSNHSWMLNSKTINGITWYHLIDVASFNDSTLFATWMSKTAFTGGSVTDRPTSPTEFAVIPLNNTTNANLAAGHNFQKIVDADGNFYFSCGQVGTGYQSLFYNASRLADARSLDTTDLFAGWHFLNSGRGAPGYSSLCSNVIGRTYNNAINISGGAHNPNFGNQSMSGSMGANGADSKFDPFPIYVACSNVGAAGIRGKFPDMYWVGSAPPGASDPTTGQQERWVCGDVLIPGSIVVAQ